MVWVVSTIGTTNKFRQNPRGDPKFLVDLTRNDPYPMSDNLNLFCSKAFIYSKRIYSM